LAIFWGVPLIKTFVTALVMLIFFVIDLSLNLLRQLNNIAVAFANSFPRVLLSK